MCSGSLRGRTKVLLTQSPFYLLNQRSLKLFEYTLPMRIHYNGKHTWISLGSRQIKSLILSLRVVPTDELQLWLNVYINMLSPRLTRWREALQKIEMVGTKIERICEEVAAAFDVSSQSGTQLPSRNIFVSRLCEAFNEEIHADFTFGGLRQTKYCDLHIYI